MPRYISVPVATPGTLSLFRHKRDFGISAAIAVIIAGAAITGATVASAMALSTLVQTATSVSAALDYQASANMQLQGGLMLVNQRIDLLQEQVDILWQLAQLGCEQKLPGLCITFIQYDNFTLAANLSRSLSQHLKLNWTADFEDTLVKLRVAIIQINSTRIDLLLTEGLGSWIQSAISYFKEWVGVGMFGFFIICGMLFVLWLVCKMKIRSNKQKAVVAQALAALEAGSPIDIWLEILK
ncbi:uncharacterized protein LOC108490811 [Nannospalax galili]|uniref:uncharacterized protein LOC108490811 n=1 Tax=Nannospalax galili TaxID=1026970 RepID=UPI000819E301|nr:uncharacterized protein LOC108490811 [Nannospalax galili]